MKLEEAIKQLETMLNCRKKQREEFKECASCDEDIQAIQTVLQELEKLKQDNYRLDRENQLLFEVQINSIPKSKIQERIAQLEKEKEDNPDLRTIQAIIIDYENILEDKPIGDEKEINEAVNNLKKLVELRKNKCREIKFDTCICGTKDLEILLQYIEELESENYLANNIISDYVSIWRELKDKMQADRMEQFDDYVIYLIDSYLEIIGGNE